jgi:hypothetical protein
MTYVELQVHVVLSNCFPLALRLFKCFGCQNAYNHVKTSGSIGSHTTNIFWSFQMDKLIGYGVELLTHFCLQGLYYLKNIYPKLKLKYEFNFLLYISIIYISKKHIIEHLLHKFVIIDRL